MPESIDDLTVIVVAFGHAAELRRALEPLHDLDVIVVDNSSSDEVATAATDSGARYVDSGANLGFAAGVNLGVRYADPASDLLLLNPDAVIDVRGVSELVTVLRSEGRAAAVAPGLYDPATGAPQRVAWPFPSPARAWVNALLPRQRGGDDFLVGACLLLARPAWLEVGAFDERFFLYAEETDWQHRAALRGWRVTVAPGVQVAHAGAGTSTDSYRREVLFHAGTETYIRKWFGTSGWMSYRMASIIGAALRSAARRGPQRHDDVMRLKIYLRGPRSVARLTS